jgi:hypothetical protein
MTRVITVFAFWFALAIAFVVMARAQAPGWRATGEWQCGPHVRIIVSSDGRDGMDWNVIGAWFDNHYTMRRGQLFYNGTPCMAVGDVWPLMTRAAPKLSKRDSPSDPRCTEDLPLDKREEFCE